MQSDEQTNSNDVTVRVSSKPKDPLVGITLDERFRIEELIGSGGMSNVYRATQLRVNRDVAIKTLKVQVDDQPIYRERFQREVDLLCALSHPNIVTVYDCLLGPDGQPCVVMDYLRGRSLEQLLEEEGPLSVSRFARIFVQVLGALDHAHRKGVVHRDIKPGNVVMLDRETDYVKVVDFGLAKFNQESRRLTHTGELWGSPPYMSPEQCMGKPDSERSDIYSTGVVMYEMLTGKDPYHHATSIYELIQCHVNVPPPPLRETNGLINVPAGLEEILFKAMAKEPADRYQSANDLKEDLVAACLKASDDPVFISGAARGGASNENSPWIGGAPGGSSGSNDSPWIGGAPGTAGGATPGSADDSPWYGGAPGTASSGSTGGLASHGGAISAASGGGATKGGSGNVSPWSREGAKKALAQGDSGANPGVGGDSGFGSGSGAGLAASGAYGSAGGTEVNSASGNRNPATSGDFGSGQVEECTVCAKPIQRQRRGSMTSWILADHHKVMEKISGVCMCSQDPSGEQSRPQARPENSVNTGMQIANLLARQGMAQGPDERSPVSGPIGAGISGAPAKHERLFEDTDKVAGKTAMRQNAERLQTNALVGNQIVTIVFALLIVIGVVFGSIQFLKTMQQNKESAHAVSAPEKETSKTVDTVTTDSGKENSSEEKAENSSKPAQKTVAASKSSSSKTKAPKTVRPRAKATRPAAKPATKSKPPKLDPWSQLNH